MKNLKKLAKAKNKTLISIAVDLGISQEAISQYISGKIYPKVTILLKMAEIFNTSTDYLLDLTDNPLPADFRLSEKELILLQNYRNLDNDSKLKIEAYAQAFNDYKNEERNN